MCVRTSQLCNTADDRALGGFGCRMNFEQLRAKFEYRVFVKADFYIIYHLVCPRQRAKKKRIFKTINFIRIYKSDACRFLIGLQRRERFI